MSITISRPVPSPDPTPEVPPDHSKVERIKAASRNLRGNISRELDEPTPKFSGESVGLLKFHGMYQQEDRDQRRARKEAGAEKHYQFMIRSKIPGGLLSADQYLAHDAIGTTYANGTLRVTTRQCFQLHGVLKGDLRPTLKTLNDHLVTTLGACGDIARNVMTCPSPTTDRERLRLEEYARAISDYTLPKGRFYHEIWVDGERVGPDEPEVEPLYGTVYLPRKFKLGLAFPGDNCIDLYTQDLGYVPHVRNGEIQGFTLLAGGGMGMTHHKKETFPRLADPIAYVTPDQLLDSVGAVIGIHRDFGDRTNRRHARLKYVVAEMGVAAIREEIGRRLGATLPAPRNLTWRQAADHLGWHRQADGRWFLGISIENGRIRDDETSATLTAVREIVSKLGCDVRLTPQQNVLLCGIEATAKADVNRILRAHRVAQVGEIPLAVRNALACPAIPTCGLALAEAERVLPAVTREIAAELDALGLGAEPISIRMTGCPNGCARPYVAEIGFVGKTAGVYDVYVGGDFLGRRLAQVLTESVPYGQLVACLVPLLQAFARERQPGERFGAYCERLGLDAVRDRAGRVAVTGAR